jgi:hypothetical protein
VIDVHAVIGSNSVDIHKHNTPVLITQLSCLARLDFLNFSQSLTLFLNRFGFGIHNPSALIQLTDIPQSVSLALIPTFVLFSLCVFNFFGLLICFVVRTLLVSQQRPSESQCDWYFSRVRFNITSNGKEFSFSVCV